ncbi:hypothetical protein AB0E01_41705 [Nocardia vinacea]|uniref:hypothetical protein n=1 Tax=Nocardia vinacea TaxID=96468 RepID=UPI003403F09B
MRAVIRLLSLSIIGLLPSGCSQVVGGHPTADAYGVWLSEQGHANVRASALIRQIDPCGFFDQSALSQFGRVVQVGPSSDLGECQVGIEPAAADISHFDAPYPAQISVALDTDLTNPGPPTTIDGVTVIEGEANQRCNYAVEFHLPGEPRPERVTILTSGFGGEKDSGLDPADCAAGMTVVRSIITANNSGQLPMRSNSTVKVPLAETDPCSLIARLPAGMSVPAGGWDPKVQPYDCKFRVRGPSKTEVVSVSFSITQTGWNDRPDSSPAEQSCHHRFPTGQVDGNIPGSRLYETLQRYARVTVMVDVVADCDDQALVTAAKQLFGS